MDVSQIKTMGKRLRKFLGEFADCFTRSEPREHLQTYVAGQLSNLPRKSIEPIALAAGTPPRTLQRLVSSVQWDEHRLRDRAQWMVARDHAQPGAIGVVDETGNPKKGRHTAAVKRQWCGNTGKVDNCVVAVHLAYVAGDFQCLLDSDLFLPEDWGNDPERRQAAGVPDEVVYRKKTDIAREQIQRALANGIRVAAWTFDEGYGRDRDFLDGLEGLGQNYVGEVPSNFTGWLREPEILQKPTPAPQRQTGRKRHFPRLSRKALPACEVRNLARYSRSFQKQTWKRYRIKEGEKGPIVWEVKSARFYRKQGECGLPGRPHTLIVARNVLQPTAIKYFLANQTVGTGATLPGLLAVAFGRFPIERCLEIGKRELGMDHFEVRSWKAIHRHLYISQLSQLFCARVQQSLREKNARNTLPDGRTGAGGGQHLPGGPEPAARGPEGPLSADGRPHRLSSTPQPAVPSGPLPRHLTQPSATRHQHQSVKIVCTP
jgi:SRSO17 transposase